MTIMPIFTRCAQAIRTNVLIKRVSATDKEYHFQNWFKARLNECGHKFETGGRNSYPDFRMVASTEGYELKGLAYHLPILVAMQVLTTTVKCPQDFTTAVPFFTSSGAIQKTQMGIRIPFSILCFAMAIS
jgi:hypothetical protein